MIDSTLVFAKRPRNQNNPRHEETLLGHTECVLSSFKLIFGNLDNPSGLAMRWLTFFGIEKNHFEEFFINGLTACGLHDLGKANDGFQSDVTGKPGNQVVRHEHVSGLIIYEPAIFDWINSIQGAIIDLIASVVISHHLKAPYHEFASPKSTRTIICLLKEGLKDTLNITATSLCTRRLSIMSVPNVWTINSDGYLKHVDKVRARLYRFNAKCKPKDYKSRLQMAIRAGLIVADSAGSALAREDKPLETWLKQAFCNQSPISGQDIQTKIIAPRINQIQQSAKTFSWNSFQDAAESLCDRALLLAPCGSGKTLAAWRWIKSQLDRNPVARVLFLYPTRATATEGFRDYVGWAPEAEAALVSGTAQYELERIFENPCDERFGKDFTTEDRLFAIGYWQKRIFSATVDQFLGFMQNSYRSVCLTPMLCDSVVVIDEVHSFDRNLFSALKRFLSNFSVPVLCMTASLPKGRREDLEGCGLEVFPQDKTEFEDLAALADLARYEVKVIDNEEAGMEVGAKELKDGKRVLWVVNTVDRCQRLAKKLNALCYHSRFTLDDRAKRHKEVVAAFQQKDRPVLAVTTQVCEMSLDLDADVLISEAAPITSLIQRMGRCNRHARIGSENTGMVCFYMPERTAPYNKEDLSGLLEFIERIDGASVSQSLLEGLLDQYGPSHVEVERYSSFLECGSWASSREESLRDNSDFNVQAILDAHVETYLKLIKQKKPADGLILPAPRKLARPERRLGRHLMVTPAANYSDTYGLMDDQMESRR